MPRWRQGWSCQHPQHPHNELQSLQTHPHSTSSTNACRCIVQHAQRPPGSPEPAAPSCANTGLPHHPWPCVTPIHAHTAVRNARASLHAPGTRGEMEPAKAGPGSEPPSEPALLCLGHLCVVPPQAQHHPKNTKPEADHIIKPNPWHLLPGPDPNPSW